MTATIQAICDALYLDLQTNVPGVADYTSTLYAMWDYSRLSALRNETAIGIWLNTDTPGALFNEGDELTQNYSILLWQDSTDEGNKRISNAAANLAWVELFEAIRSRLYLIANESLHGATGVELSKYAGGQFVPHPQLRIMELHVEVKTLAGYL